MSTQTAAFPIIDPLQRFTATEALAILRDQFTPETWTRAVIDEVVALERAAKETSRGAA